MYKDLPCSFSPFSLFAVLVLSCCPMLESETHIEINRDFNRNYFNIHRKFIGSMPIYKLHEAPRVEPSFSNQHAANLPPVRVPLQSQVTPVPEPSSVPSSAAASTMSSPAANVVQGNSLPINPQSPPPSPDPSRPPPNSDRSIREMWWCAACGWPGVRRCHRR